jgi:ATP-dependent protease ClpP protease subunit
MRAASTVAGATVINIYDVIGYDYWTGGGVTSDMIASQIKGKGDLVININSPGGDFFEGLAIHNMLRAHQGTKTVNIVALAASSASLIAAAGAYGSGQVRIAPAAYSMIHNVWGIVIGNKNDMTEAAAAFEKFDQGARVIYHDQTGKPDEEIAQLMDDETWFLGQEAVDAGFASAILPADATLEDQADPSARAIQDTMSLRRMEAILCRSMSRKEARQLIKNIKGDMRDAVAPGKQDAAVLSAAADGLRGFLSNL